MSVDGANLGGLPRVGRCAARALMDRGRPDGKEKTGD